MKTLVLAGLLSIASSIDVAAQELTVRRTNGTEQRFAATRLAALTKVSVEVLDNGVTKRFEGIDLRTLLRVANAGPVDSIRGPQLRRVVIVRGSDGYAAAIALAELDPSLGARQVLLVSGQERPGEPAGLRAVFVGDGRAARWVRQVARVEVVEIP